MTLDIVDNGVLQKKNYF